MTNDKIVANAMSCSCRQLSSNTVFRRYIQITDLASSTDMQRCATSCTNDKRWPFFQTNYMVVSMQPANSDVFCSPLPRPSHIPASPPGFGRAPHPLEWSHRDKLWHPTSDTSCRGWTRSGRIVISQFFIVPEQQDKTNLSR